MTVKQGITTSDILPNPFVGPRPFKPNEKLYGRDREAFKLLHLIIAERIVLLHSPSGAGKTSLLQASISKSLREHSFVVCPIIRINEPTQPLESPLNRYLVSAFRSLVPNWQSPSGACDYERTLADLLLYSSTQVGPEELVVIFDQFEEILTLDHTDIDIKREFFEVIGRTLRNQNIWAVFSMRDDYVAALAPYRDLVPSCLNTTFRLDLLTPAAAIEAIRRPALNQGVDITEDAATKLVDYLRSETILHSGQAEIRKGPFVEPVHLQIVCEYRWNLIDPRQPRVEAGDILIVRDIDVALQKYYEYHIREIVKTHNYGINELTLRTWFDRHLISGAQTREPVPISHAIGFGIDEVVLIELEDRYLIRPETRGTRIWYELAHDRLIQPILTSNADWFDSYGEHYARQVAAIAVESNISERRIRQWIGEELISASGARVKMTWEEALEYDLGEDVLRALVQTSLLSTYRRDESTILLELSNTRLISTIVANNNSFLSGTRSRIDSSGYANSVYAVASKFTNDEIAIRKLEAQIRQWIESKLIRTDGSLGFVRKDVSRSGGLDNVIVMALEDMDLIRSRRHQGSIKLRLTNDDLVEIVRQSNESWFRRWIEQYPWIVYDIARKFEVSEMTVRHWVASRLVTTSTSFKSMPFVEKGNLNSEGLENGIIARLEDAAIVTTEKHATGTRFVLAHHSLSRVIIDSDAIWNESRHADFNRCVKMAAQDEYDERRIRKWMDLNLIETRSVHMVDNLDEFDRMADLSLSIFKEVGLIPDIEMPQPQFRDFFKTNTVLLPFVHQNNRDWYRSNPSVLQRRAALWKFNKGDLLSDMESLRMAEQWSNENDDEMTAVEKEFLEQSVIAYKRNSIRRRRVRLWLGVASLLAVVFGGVSIVLMRSLDSAIKEAKGYELVSRALNQITSGRIDAALLIGLEADRYDNTSGSWAGLLSALLQEPFIDGYLHQHSGLVRSISFSRDSKYLASASFDSTIMLWDVETHQPLLASKYELNDRVVGIGFVFRDTVIVGTRGGKIVYLAAARSGTSGFLQLRVLRTIDLSDFMRGKDGMRSFAVSPGGNHVACGFLSGTLVQWSPAGDKFVSIRPDTLRVSCVAYNLDGTLLANGGSGKRVSIWKVTDSALSKTNHFDQHSGEVLGIAFSPHRNRVASSDRSGRIWLWDMDGSEYDSLGARNGEQVYCIAFSPTGDTVLSCGTDNNVILWRVSERTPIDTLLGHQWEVLWAAYSRDGRRIASSSFIGDIILYNVSGTGGIKTVVSRSYASISGISLHSDDRLLAYGGTDGVRIIDRTTGNPITTLLPQQRVASVAFSPTQPNLLAAGDSNGLIVLWDWASGSHDTLRGHKARDPVNDVAFSPDGRTLASASDDNTIRLWGIQEMDSLCPALSAHTSRVISLAFSDDGKWLASGDLGIHGFDGGKIILWDITKPTSPQNVRMLVGHSLSIMGLSFQRGSKVLASGGSDGAIILWNISDPAQKPRTFDGRGETITFISFNRAGTLLLSGTFTGTVNIWDVKDQVQIGLPLRLHNQWITGIAFAQDDSMLVTSSRDFTISATNLRRPLLRSQACRIAGRNLTPVEWTRHIGKDEDYHHTCSEYQPRAGALE